MRGAALGALAGAALVTAHGSVTWPPPRSSYNIRGSSEGVAGSCAGGMCYWYNEYCKIGCKNGCTKGCGGGKTTLPDYARTYRYRGAAGSNDVSPCGDAPWCAPGSAPIRSPCGWASGGSGVYAQGSSYTPNGVKMNMDGRDLKELPGVNTVWHSGTTVNISWSVNANHGGGYQYRLCKKSARPTEECFQAMPMKFASAKNFIKYCPQDMDKHVSQKCCESNCPNAIGHSCKQSYSRCNGKSISFPAVDVSTGTTPAGSTWRRNPIPGCKVKYLGADGLHCGATNGANPSDYQFTPPGRDESRPSRPQNDYPAGRYDWLAGFGAGGGCDDPPTWATYFSFNIVDEVVVPDVPPGDYIMSWRWDVEQGAQIWSSCADVTIKNDGPAPKPPAPKPPAPPAPKPPAPGPASSKYACHSESGKCTADADGLSLESCQRICKPPTKYACQDSKCIADADGVGLADCQKVCKN